MRVSSPWDYRHAEDATWTENITVSNVSMLIIITGIGVSVQSVHGQRY